MSWPRPWAIKKTSGAVQEEGLEVEAVEASMQPRKVEVDALLEEISDPQLLSSESLNSETITR